MLTEEKIYNDLQKYLDRLPISYPATESGVELRILKHLFTPEEAEIAINLSMQLEPLERIYRRVDNTSTSLTKRRSWPTNLSTNRRISSFSI